MLLFFKTHSIPFVFFGGGRFVQTVNQTFFLAQIMLNGLNLLTLEGRTLLQRILDSPRTHEATIEKKNMISTTFPVVILTNRFRVAVRQFSS